MEKSYDRDKAAIERRSDKMQNVTGDLPRGLLYTGIAILGAVCLAMVFVFILLPLPGDEGSTLLRYFLGR